MSNRDANGYPGNRKPCRGHHRKGMPYVGFGVL
jgi:hypothetical protein